VKFHFLIFTILFSYAYIHTSTITNQPNCKPKILILIAMSDNLPVYQKLQTLWRKYMHSNSKHIVAYFIRGKDSLNAEWIIDKDTIWTKTVENYIPGMVNKTILSMEAMLPQINDFDYILRTTVSSFFIFPRLIKFLENCPSKCFYCSVPGYDNKNECLYGSGAGFIITPDIVKMLVRDKKNILNNMSNYDDVLIGKYLSNHQIILTRYDRLDLFNTNDWTKFMKNIPKNIFHIKVKHIEPDKRMAFDPYVYSKLLTMFYGLVA